MLLRAYTVWHSIRDNKCGELRVGLQSLLTLKPSATSFRKATLLPSAWLSTDWQDPGLAILAAYQITGGPSPEVACTNARL